MERTAGEGRSSKLAGGRGASTAEVARCVSRRGHRQLQTPCTSKALPPPVSQCASAPPLIVDGNICPKGPSALLFTNSKCDPVSAAVCQRSSGDALDRPCAPSVAGGRSSRLSGERKPCLLVFKNGGSLPRWLRRTDTTRG